MRHGSRNVGYGIMHNAIYHECRIGMGGWMRGLEASTLVDSHIHQYGAWFHQLQHVSGNQVWSLVARNEYTAYYDVNIWQFLPDIVLVGVEGVRIDWQFHLQLAKTRQTDIGNPYISS